MSDDRSQAHSEEPRIPIAFFMTMWGAMDSFSQRTGIPVDELSISVGYADREHRQGLTLRMSAVRESDLKIVATQIKVSFQELDTARCYDGLSKTLEENLLKELVN